VPTGATFNTATKPSQDTSPKAATTATSSKFRGDIQGLRAVAVLSVALDHANIGVFSGGYVGVDVFFVISGFLITQLLLAEWQRTGAISLSSFYARRARRILPAATLVLIATVTAGLIWLNFIRAKSLITDAIWATFFAANVHFGREGTDYFAADNPPSALQHYWSLAVEEQFYLVWPLLLALLLGALLVWRGRSSGQAARSMQQAKLRVLVGLGVISAASFYYCVQLTTENQTAAYFSTLARVWELGLGAAFAVLVPRLGKLPIAVRSLMQWAGLALIAYAIFTFTDTTKFPGSAVLIPVLGAALVLGGGAGPRPVGIRALLENPPMLRVGDWSYSFYLWHWPFLVIPAEHVGHELTTVQNLLLLAAALAVSALTYVLVENPFRRAKLLSIRPRGSLLLYPCAVAVTLLVCAAANVQVNNEIAETANAPAITTDNFGANPGTVKFSKDKSKAIVQASVEAAENHVAIPGNLNPGLVKLNQNRADVGDCDYTYAIHRLCERGTVGAEKTMILFGDSHARHWIPTLEKIAEREGYATYYLVKPGCNSAQMTPALSEGVVDDCLQWRDWSIDQIKDLQPDIVVLAGDVPDAMYDDDGDRINDREALSQAYSDGLVETIDMIGDAATQKVIIGDVPGVDIHPVDCLADTDHDMSDCTFSPDRVDRLELAAAKRAAEIADATYIDPMPWFCADNLCPTVVGSTIVYRDLNHVTPEYAESLARPFEAKMGLVAQSSQ